MTWLMKLPCVSSMPKHFLHICTASWKLPSPALPFSKVSLRLLAAVVTSINIFVSHGYHNPDRRDGAMTAEAELTWLRWDYFVISCATRLSSQCYGGTTLRYRVLPDFHPHATVGLLRHLVRGRELVSKPQSPLAAPRVAYPSFEYLRIQHAASSCTRNEYLPEPPHLRDDLSWVLTYDCGSGCPTLNLRDYPSWILMYNVWTCPLL